MLFRSKYKKENRALGDQDIINQYLPDWYNQKQLILDEGYNLFASYLTHYIKNEGYSLQPTQKKLIYIVHFTGSNKPWNIRSIKDYLRIIKHIAINPYLGNVLYEYWKLLKKVRT